MKPLLMRPIPHNDESAASLLIRVAEENGYRNVYKLFSCAGILINEPVLLACTKNRLRYSHLIKALGLPYEYSLLPLERKSESNKSARIFNSYPFPNECFHRKEELFCPHCLQEDSYLRNRWLIRPLSVCLRHGIFLLDQCAHCKLHPSLGRGSITMCNNCQNSLADIVGAPANIEAIETFDKMFEAKDFEKIQLCIDFWIALTRFENLEKRPELDYRRFELSVLFTCGQEAAFEEVCSKVVRNLDSKGPKIQMLPFLSGSPALKRFADEVLTKIWPLTTLANKDTRLSYLTKKEVCVILKLSPARLQAMIDRGEFLWPSEYLHQKLATTEAELVKFGFSQTELMHFYRE